MSNKIIQKVFSAINDKTNHKVITIFGIKFKFKNHINFIYKAIKNLNNDIKFIKNLLSKIYKNSEQTQKILENITKKNKINESKLNQLYSANYTKEKYYSNNFEKDFIKPFFEYLSREDFSEKYLTFIKNLSNDDIAIFNKILQRVKTIGQNPTVSVHRLYNVAEQQEHIKLVTDFKEQILQLTERLFAYKHYLLPINHFEPCVFYHRHGVDLVKDKSKLKNNCIIDAGGYIGDSALVLSPYTNEKIYSFEANPDNYKVMLETREINQLNKIVPVNKALYSSNCQLEFNWAGSAGSIMELCGVKYGEKISVDAITLDDFVKENNLRVGLIKVDLEGAEQEFIKGALNTIKTQKPTLLISIYHRPEDLFEIKPLLESLNLGYKFRIFCPVDFGILLETMLIAECDEQ